MGVFLSGMSAQGQFSEVGGRIREVRSAPRNGHSGPGIAFGGDHGDSESGARTSQQVVGLLSS
jgi:hypothetical protein